MTYSLTTDQPTYQVGQSIQITFTETNTSTQPVTVSVAPTDFSVSQGSYAVWQSDPDNANQPPTSETLQPGQSLTQTASWDGTTPDSFDSSGTVNYWGTFVVSDPNAPQGLTATFQITDPIATSLTTDQPVYQMGQPVQVTFTQTNTSDQPVTFGGGSATAFLVYQDGAPLWLLAYPQVITGPMTLQAGQTQTITQQFNGPDELGLGVDTGTFVVGYGPENDPELYTTTFQVAPPPLAPRRRASRRINRSMTPGSR